MNLTDYQAKYFAYELTKRSPSDSMEKLASAVASAQVDLNPHQVDAALFAFRSQMKSDWVKQLAIRAPASASCAALTSQPSQLTFGDVNR